MRHKTKTIHSPIRANDEMGKKLVVVLGPTASGKTRLAVALARKFNGEIVSSDSRQVYRGMDIGTGKDLREYGKGKNRVPYHLIDIVSPKTQFNAGRYQKLAYRAIDNILKRGKTPFLVGGTGLYIQSVVDGLVFPQAKADQKLRRKLSRMSPSQLLAKLKQIDPATYKIIDRKNRRRVERAVEICLLTGIPLSQQRKKTSPPYKILQIGIVLPKEKLHQKIDTRLRLRLKNIVKETKRIKRESLSWKRLDDFGLEYRYASRYLRGEISYEQMAEQLSRAIKDFAKRQMTWFKRDKRIHWIRNKNEANNIIKIFLSS